MPKPKKYCFLSSFVADVFFSSLLFSSFLFSSTFKVGRMLGEPSTDLSVVGNPVKDAFEAFASSDGRKLKLEIEPGTFLLANAGAVVTSVQDKVRWELRLVKKRSEMHTSFQQSTFVSKLFSNLIVRTSTKESNTAAP